MLHEMGIATGIDLGALLDAARARTRGARPPARLAHARRRARSTGMHELSPRPDRQPRRDRGPRRAHGARARAGDASASSPTPTPAPRTPTRSTSVGRRSASYLDAAELLRAARAAGARSVHPGYGFLSRERGVRARGASTRG